METERNSSSMEMAEQQSLTLLKLPAAVIRNHLLPYLHPADILRLQYVHPITRGWVEEVSDTKVLVSIWQNDPIHFIVVDDDLNGMGHLLSLKSPNPLGHSSRFFIKNMEWDFYGDINFSRFVTASAVNIQHLHIQRYTLCSVTSELKLYTALVNLKFLDIDLVDMRNILWERKKTPKVFNNVIQLGIAQIKYGGSVHDQINQRNYIRDEFFASFKNLKKLKCPKEDVTNADRQLIPQYPEIYRLPFLKIFNFLSTASHKDENITLKILDLQAVREFHLDTFEFMRLVAIAYRHGVEIRNLPAHYLKSCVDPASMELFSRMRGVPTEIIEEGARAVLNATVTSALNLTPCMFTSPWPNLKKVSVTHCSWCLHDLPTNPMRSPDEFRIDWPNLKDLSLNINRQRMGLSYLQRGHIGELNDTDVFLKYLFGEPNGRKSLRRLKLLFHHLKMEYPLQYLMPLVASSCRNLTKLELWQWQDTEESYWPLWESLSNLKELFIVRCTGFSDEALLGPLDRNCKTPLFLKLTSLQTLVLNDLEQMLGVTDIAFQQVLKYMPLKEFLVTGHRLKYVSLSGIQSLLDGPFRDSIQFFPFVTWSLNSVESEEDKQKLLELHSQFRSTALRRVCHPDQHMSGIYCGYCRVLCSLCFSFSGTPNIMDSAISIPRHNAERGEGELGVDERPLVLSNIIWSRVWNCFRRNYRRLPTRRRLEVVCLLILLFAAVVIHFVILLSKMK